MGAQEYGLPRRTVQQMAERDCVVGLILAQHQLSSGVSRRRTRMIEQPLEVIHRHVDRIAGITDSHTHTAIGSDFNGFIKPTVGGLESMADVGRHEQALRDHYGADDARLIASSNALRLLRSAWS